MIARLDELLGREISLRWLNVLRTLTGPIVVLHLWPYLTDVLDGVQYRDFFYEPYASWYPELPRGAYAAAIVLGVLAGAAMVVRRVARVATIVALAVVAYNVLLSTTHFHNNRAFLLIVLGVLAVTPVAPAGPAWPLWLLRAEVVVVYAASGGSKLLDGDWFGGAVTHQRVLNVRARLVDDTPLPGWSVDVLTDRSFHTVAAKVIVLTELFIAFGLLWRRTRAAAVVVAVLFHVAIEVTASVQVFSLLALAALVIWRSPELEDQSVKS